MTQGPAYAWESKNNPWRQGSVLCRRQAVDLGLLRADAPEAMCAVVITHDCDLALPASAGEPAVELILGKLLQEPDPGLTTTKSLRRIHLRATHAGASAAIELSIHERCLVDKIRFAAWYPSTSTRIDPAAVKHLRRWLAARYARESFPSTFNDRLAETGIAKGLEKILSGAAGAVVNDVYFRIEGDPMAELPDDVPYALRILVAFADGADSLQSGQLAQKAADDVGNLIESRCFDTANETWHQIALRSCASRSHSALTLADIGGFQVWRLEYVTVRRGGAEPAIS